MPASPAVANRPAVSVVAALCALTLCHVPVAHARLWESTAELFSRYGQPLATEPNGDECSYQFNHAGFTIWATVWRGVSQSEYFVKIEGGPPEPWEVDALLEANADGRGRQAWAEAEESKLDLLRTVWQRTDGTASAVRYYAKSPSDGRTRIVLAIQTREFHAKAVRRADAEQRERMKGF